MSNSPVGVITCSPSVADCLKEFMSKFDISNIECLKKDDLHYFYFFDLLEFSFSRFDFLGLRPA